MVWPYVSGRRKVVTPRRLVQACAIALGLLVLATCTATVILDSVLHSAGTGGPVVEAVSIAAAGNPPGPGGRHSRGHGGRPARGPASGQSHRVATVRHLDDRNQSDRRIRRLGVPAAPRLGTARPGVAGRAGTVAFPPGGGRGAAVGVS